MPEKYRTTAGAVVFQKDEETGVFKFLVVQRAKDDHFPLFWEFPRGSCEKNEVVANCMMREVKEESGLDVIPVKYLGKTEYFSEKHGKITKCFIFLSKAKGEKIKLNYNGAHEHEDGKWLVPEVVREMVLPDQRIFIDRALEYLKPAHEYQKTDPSKKPSVVRENKKKVYDSVTYNVYCEALEHAFNDTLTEGFFSSLKQTQLSRDLVKVFRDLKTGIARIGRDFKIGITDLISAFKQRQMYDALKAFGFNFKLMFRAIGEATKALKGGLLSIFKALYKTKAIQQLKRGAIKVDDILNKYPKLKAVGGIVIAGLLLYIWLNMTFIGDLDYDFNFSDMLGALKGTYSIADLFVSPQGLMLIALFGSGTALGLSMPWLGKTAYNFTLALVYTAYHKLKGHDRKFKDVIKRFQSKMKKERIR